MMQGLDRCRERNLKLSREKCHFRVSEVRCVGHMLNADGVKPDPQEVEAINTMPQSQPIVKTYRGFWALQATYLSSFQTCLRKALRCASYSRRMLNSLGEKQKTAPLQIKP